MKSEFCPKCGCLKLPNGYCRDKNCLYGNYKQASEKQIDLINKLCEEQQLDLKINPLLLTTEEASKLINRLIKRKVRIEMYGKEAEL